MYWFDDLEVRHFDVNQVRIFARVSPGLPSGRPVLLLLHGFPQSHALWNQVAQALHRDFYLVIPDLRGYGDSSKPPGLPDHSSYSKRCMAQDMADVMDLLGTGPFGACGHDRGGRVAHRLALDHPAHVQRLCVIDIAPTLDMVGTTDFALAQAYYHWHFLSQPEPLPEMLIGATPQSALYYLHHTLGGWGSSGLAHIQAAALAEYERSFLKAETVHAMCEDYRASAGIDLEHDRASRACGDKIGCDMRVLWGERGVVHRLFKPLPLWQAQCAGHATGKVLAAGHFIPEELAQETAAELDQFFAPD